MKCVAECNNYGGQPIISFPCCSNFQPIKIGCKFFNQLKLGANFFIFFPYIFAFFIDFSSKVSLNRWIPNKFVPYFFFISYLLSFGFISFVFALIISKNADLVLSFPFLSLLRSILIFGLCHLSLFSHSYVFYLFLQSWMLDRIIRPTNSCNI
jgi:hypothetical protein